MLNTNLFLIVKLIYKAIPEYILPPYRMSLEGY